MNTLTVSNIVVSMFQIIRFNDAQWPISLLRFFINIKKTHNTYKITCYKSLFVVEYVMIIIALFATDKSL